MSELVVDHPLAAGDLTLTFPRTSSDITIAFPNEAGTVLTSASSFSSLQEVGALSKGSIVQGFGSITTANDISTTGSGKITASGALVARSSVQVNT